MIEGIKLIRHNASNLDLPDDPSYPWKLYANLRPPDFMTIAFIGMYGGSEEICVRGKTKKVLEEYAETIGLNNHPRLRKLEITQPEKDTGK